MVAHIYLQLLVALEEDKYVLRKQPVLLQYIYHCYLGKSEQLKKFV